MACLKTTLALCLLGLVMMSFADDMVQTEQDDDTLERQVRQTRRMVKAEDTLVKEEKPSCKCRNGYVAVSLSTCALKPVKWFYLDYLTLFLVALIQETICWLTLSKKG